MVLTLPAFPHRQNGDGSFDSIGLACLLTITSAKMEAELTKHEKNHVCGPLNSVLTCLRPSPNKGINRMKQF
jgi:hypothetical protein